MATSDVRFCGQFSFFIRFFFFSPDRLLYLSHAPLSPPPPPLPSIHPSEDIGANLCDPMFQGSYGGKSYHEPDLRAVLSRAASAGVAKIIVTAGSLAESEEAQELASSSSYSDPTVELFCSAGVHPTRAGELVIKKGGGGAGGEEGKPTLDAAAVGRLRALLEKGARGGGGGGQKLVALGETGLDYARLQFSGPEAQKLAFEAQLDLAADFGGKLPLFLHLRDAGDDFVSLLSKPRFRGTSSPSAAAPSPSPVALRGVVHSFDGGVELMRRLLALENRDLFIGLNGCSLRDGAGLETARRVPLDRLLLETDSPWCDLRPTHASASQERFKLKAFDEEHGVAWKDKKKASSEGGLGGGGGGGGGGGTGVLIKGRNEPCRVAAVAAAVAAARGCSVAEVARAAWENSERLFWGVGGGGG